MTIQEALNILKPQGNTPDHVQKVFWAMAKQYHPDINPHGGEMMKLINLAREVLLENLGAWDSAFIDYENQSISEELQEIFDRIAHLQGLSAEICGIWLWLSGNTYPVKEILKTIGFKWAHQKKMWYYHTGEFKKRRSKTLDMETIREKYGSVKMSFRQVNAVA